MVGFRIDPLLCGLYRRVGDACSQPSRHMGNSCGERHFCVGDRWLGDTVDSGDSGSDAGATTGGSPSDNVNDDGFIQDFTDLSPGGECDDGGVQVDSGYDENGDGSLGGDEVLGSDVYCYDLKSASEGCQGAPMPLPWALGIFGLLISKFRRRRFIFKM